MSDVEIGNAIIAGIADGETILEKMAEIIDHLRLAGFVIVPIGGGVAQRPPLEPRFEKLRARLLHAITTASNDDLSNPMSEKRERHCERVAAMYVAIDFIDATLGLVDSAVPSTHRGDT